MKRLFGLLAAVTTVVALVFIVGRDVLINIALAKRPENVALAKRSEEKAGLTRRSAQSLSLNAPTPPPIVSISICSSDSLSGTLAQGSCAPGTFDTHQIVLGPGNKSVNSSGLGAGAVPDEHSTVFGPNTLGGNSDYIFFLATGSGGDPNIGVSVLSGGSGPQNGQWTLNTQPTPAPSATPPYGWYGSSIGFGPVFEHSTKPDICPPTADGSPNDQDETFDMGYASAGSIVKDPTAPAGSMLMIYEGANGCIGNSGGVRAPDADSYISLGIATSVDYGKNWPTYRGNPFFDYHPLPKVNPSQAPNYNNGVVGSLGKWGADVCQGNCPPDNTASPSPLDSYGRYAVVTPTTSLDSLMRKGVPLTGKDVPQYKEQEISGFVDDVSADPTKYLYVNWGSARMARAQLTQGQERLSFWKWNGNDFTTVPGMGGDETKSSVLPSSGAFENCGDPKQNQFGSSISYVEQTHQYLLTFVCVSDGDPKYGANQDGANKGAAWFWATSYDLSHPEQFSQPDPLGRAQPHEIEGSWSDFSYPVSSSSPSPSTCEDYKGFYPSFMSLNQSAGHLSIDGYVFYLWGCQQAGSKRQFSSRAFKITTTDTTPPVTAASVAGPLGLYNWYTGPTTVSFTATDDLSGVATTEYSLDNGATWTTGTSVSLTKSAIYNILYRSIDVDENVETPKSITVNLDSKAPAITESASPSIIYDNVRVVSVTVSGTINDNLSGVDPTTAQFAVHDEYGRVEPSGPVTIASDGSYSFIVALRTFVRAKDTDGRQYTIHVSAVDNAGNKRTTETVVTAKRFKLTPPPPCKTNCV